MQITLRKTNRLYHESRPSTKGSNSELFLFVALVFFYSFDYLYLIILVSIRFIDANNFTVYRFYKFIFFYYYQQ